MPRQSHQEKFFEVKAHCMTYPGRNCGSSVASFPGKARWAEIAICQLSFVGPTSVSVSRWLPLHLSRRLAGEGRLSGSAAAVITRAATVTSRRAPARWRTGVAVAGRRGGRWRGRGEGRLAGGGIGRRRRIRWENLGEFSRHPILRFSSLSVRPAIPQCSNFTVQDKSLCWCRTQLEFFRFAAVFFFLDFRTAVQDSAGLWGTQEEWIIPHDFQEEEMIVSWCSRNKNGPSIPSEPFTNQEESVHISCWFFPVL